MSRRTFQGFTIILCTVGLYASLLSAGELDAAVADASNASGSSLQVKPASCVALHRGQPCFKEVALSWAVLEEGQYCLFDDTANSLLHCAFGFNGAYKHMYSSNTSISYTLRHGEQGPVIAQVSVRTSWVYRTGRRSSSGWRLF